MASLSRKLKSVTAIALILGGIGYYANERFRLVSSYAVVAGPSFVVQAPGDGVLSHSVRVFSVLNGGAALGSVRPIPTNDPELRAVSAELGTVRAEVASLKELIALGEDLRNKSASRQSALSRQRAEHLQRLYRMASADVAVKEAAYKSADVALRRSVGLCAEGLMAKADCEDAQSRAEVGARELDSAAGQADVARFLLQASKSGNDVGQDMGSEVTYARQQRDELTLRLASLRQQLETQEARAAGLEHRLAPPAFELTASSRSRAWSVLHESGATVQKGEPLFELVDCNQAFVFATVSSERYEKLHLGMQAEVEVNGRVLPGKLVQMLGPYGTFTQERGMRPQPPVIVSPRDATNESVAVEVPGLGSALGASCGIGMRAEVRFVP